jgi:hypothetical protein
MGSLLNSRVNGDSRWYVWQLFICSFSFGRASWIYWLQKHVNILLMYVKKFKINVE